MRRARWRKYWLGLHLDLRSDVRQRHKFPLARFRLSLPLAALNTAAWVVLLYNSASSSEPGSNGNAKVMHLSCVASLTCVAIPTCALPA